MLDFYHGDSGDDVSGNKRAGIYLFRAKLYTALSEAYDEGSEGWTISLKLAKADYEEILEITGDSEDILLAVEEIDEMLDGHADDGDKKETPGERTDEKSSENPLQNKNMTRLAAYYDKLTELINKYGRSEIRTKGGVSYLDGLFFAKIMDFGLFVAYSNDGGNAQSAEDVETYYEIWDYNDGRLEKTADLEPYSDMRGGAAAFTTGGYGKQDFLLVDLAGAIGRHYGSESTETLTGGEYISIGEYGKDYFISYNIENVIDELSGEEWTIDGSGWFALKEIARTGEDPFTIMHYEGIMYKTGDETSGYAIEDGRMIEVRDGEFGKPLEELHDETYDGAVYETYCRAGDESELTETSAVLDETIEYLEKILGIDENGQPSSEEAGSDEWKEEYIAYLKNADESWKYEGGSVSKSYKYYLLNIDGDDIPELYVSSLNEKFLFTFDSGNGMAVWALNWSLGYNKDDNTLIDTGSDTGGGNTHYNTYTLVNGEPVLSHSESLYIDFDDGNLMQGNYADWEMKYYHDLDGDTTQVTEDEFYSLLEDLNGRQEQYAVNSSTEKAYTYSTIFDAIKSY